MKQKTIQRACAVAPIVLGLIILFFFSNPTHEVIKVGILHSTSGPLAVSEGPLIDALLLGIEEINKAGGLLGKKLEPIIADGMSDPAIFEQQAQELLTEYHVDVIFGCWTAESRQKVKPLVEKHNRLLFYSIQYEGTDESDNIVYVGAAPNQQIIPGISYCLNNFGKRFFMVGSNDIYSRVSHDIIEEYLKRVGGELVNSSFITDPHTELTDVIDSIKQTKPDVIINTLVGEQNRPFFRELFAAHIKPDNQPIISFGVGEAEIDEIGAPYCAGSYASSSYFSSLASEENHSFLAKMHHKYGITKRVGEPEACAYASLHLWAQAVKQTGSLQTLFVRQALYNQNYDAPEGVIVIDSRKLVSWKQARIGKITPEGEFRILWDSQKPIAQEIRN